MTATALQSSSQQRACSVLYHSGTVGGMGARWAPWTGEGGFLLWLQKELRHCRLMHESCVEGSYHNIASVC